MFFLSISFITAAVISYEILLMRLFSIIQWHHFAYMIISIALLGFGASGTFIYVTRRWLIKRFPIAYILNAVLFGLFSQFSFFVAEHIRFNPLEIVWNGYEFFYLLTLYLILAVPFFCAANCIGLAFTAFKNMIGRIYLFDLIGAGVGALGVVLALFVVLPTSALRFVFVLALVAGALATRDRRFNLPHKLTLALILFSIVVPITIPRSLGRLIVSEYKSLSGRLLVPDSKILEERSSPYGFLTVVGPGIIPFREAPGLSLTSDAEPPEQLGIFTDGDSLSVITRYDGDKEKLAYLDELPQALPYHLLNNPDTLILGAGGGSDVLSAIYHGASEVTAVEINPQVADLVRSKYREFAGDIYNISGVRLNVAESRRFLAKTDKNYDLIEITLMDSFHASSAGIYALSEGYLYTAQAIEEYVRHLKPGGILAITRWSKIPPRDGLKLFATAADALKRLGAEPGRHLALIRGFKTSTLLVKNGEILAHDIAAIRAFCERRSFDRDYHPEIEAKETNRFNRMERSYLYEGAMAILGESRDEFIEDYKFNIAPASDDRPYFFDFFKWQTLPELISLKGRGGEPLIELGYPILVATLLQAIFVGIVLIVVPIGLKRVGYSQTKGRGWVLLYFLSLGLSFLFIEMAFIQRFTLFLGNPIYTVAVVISSFLICAGLGSGLSGRLVRAFAGSFQSARPLVVTLAVAGISLTAIFYIFVLPTLFSVLIGLSDTWRIFATTVLISPLGFFMGMPFPQGLEHIGEINPTLIPWAWGINGLASVISPVLATLLAIHFGFTAVIAVAAGLYVLAALAIWRFHFNLHSPSPTIYRGLVYILGRLHPGRWIPVR